MKRISILILLATLFTAPAFGEDATQQQIDKLTGQIQDLLAAQGKQDQVIAELRKEIAELNTKLNAPQVNDNATREDLKKLADQMQEIDKKRIADRENILKAIEKVAKMNNTAAHTPPPVRNTDPVSDAGNAAPLKGYEYVVKAGDTIGIIAKAYRDQGVKVTTAQIIKANPNLDPNKLIVGKKIFIPDPAAK